MDQEYLHVTYIEIWIIFGFFEKYQRVLCFRPNEVQLTLIFFST